MALKWSCMVSAELRATAARGDLMGVWAKWAARATESDPGEGIGCWRPLLWSCARPAGQRAIAPQRRRRPLGVTWSQQSQSLLSRRVSLSRMRDSASRRRRRGGFGLKAYSYWPYAACSILPLATLLPLALSLGPIMMLMMMVF
jgi:hypothetical protein